MKKTAIVFTSALLAVSVNIALADRIGGSPKADFHNDELIIPCVKITGLSDATEGTFFDVVLSRRGNSFIYELSTAKPEDVIVCKKIANFAEFEDDDFENPDDDADVVDILVECEVRPDRSKISVKGKNLGAGEYYAVVTSGNNSTESDQHEPVDDEVEFDFDSNVGDIAEGAVPISADFITGDDPEVMGEIFLAGSVEPLLSETVSCSLDD
ncbi:MAG: hypothetical protein WBM84_02945 [Sedimenticolaceae bacterium]